MLPAEHRMRRSEDFSRAVRQGRRSGSTHLVAHLWVPAAPIHAPSAAHLQTPLPPGGGPTLPTPQPARVGFVVSKAIGNAVSRTSVKRRLRAVAGGHLKSLPPGTLLVIRANPAAAGASSAELAQSLARSLARLSVMR